MDHLKQLKGLCLIIKDKTTFTITTHKGSKSYTVGEMAKIGFWYFLYGVLALFVITIGVIYSLSNKLDEYHNLDDQNFQLMSENLQLENSIYNQEQKLSSIENMVSHIENLMSQGSDKEIALNTRLDSASITLSERSLMLRLIPNGSPIEYKGITSKFGWRTNPISSKRQYHAGVDMRARYNTKLYAPADGIVEIARKKKKGFGNLIILNHYMGIKTLYGHLNRLKVKTGDFVHKGQLIGTTGSSGNSSGPHLHYEVHYISRALNPVHFNNWSLETYDTIFKNVKRVHWDNLTKGLKWQWTQQQQLLSPKALVSTGK